MHNLPSRFGKLLLFFIVVGVLSVPASASAQQQQEKYTGLIIRTPAEFGGFTYEFFMDPGETKCSFFIGQHDFSQLNKSVTVYTLASDLEIDPSSRQPVFPTKRLVLDHQYSLASWVSFQDQSITLPQWGAEHKVNFCVTVPQGATAGSHYSVLFLSNITREQYLQTGDLDAVLGGNSGAAIGSMTGVNLIVTVSGEVRKNVEVNSLTVTDIDYHTALFNIFEYVPLNFMAGIVNDGNQFARPAGNISVHQGDLSQPLFFTKFNPNGERILPNSTMQFVTNWNDAPLYIYQEPRKVLQQESGSQNTEYDYKLGINLAKMNELKFGHYFVTLQMTYYDVNGDFKRTPDYTVGFWIIPWKLILAVIAIIGGFIFVRRLQNQSAKGDKVKYISRKAVKRRSRSN